MKLWRFSFQVIHLLAFAFFAAGCSSEDQDIRDFIIGRWHGELTVERNGQTSPVEIEFEFNRSGRLIYNSRSDLDPPIEFWSMSNYVARYAFTDDNTIELSEARLVGGMRVTRSGDVLFINSFHTDGQEVLFTRRPVIPWGWVSLILGIVLLGLFRLGKDRVLNFKHQEVNLDLGNVRLIEVGKFYLQIVSQVITMLLVAYVGAFITADLWYSAAIRQIRLPWDAVISIEIGVFLASLGVVSILSALSEIREKRMLFSLSRYLLGSFLIGCSFWGLLRGSLSLIMFLKFGVYL
jgi:hypothetical protein